MEKNLKTDYRFRLAKNADSNQIWDLLQMAILRRKQDGSNQWQDGYPNIEVIKDDIQKKYGYVLSLKEEIVGYCALLINNEPDYLNIEGQWLTNNDFVVFHRLAISEKFLNKGLAKKMVSFIEQFAISKNIFRPYALPCPGCFLNKDAYKNNTREFWSSHQCIENNKDKISRIKQNEMLKKAAEAHPSDESEIDISFFNTLE